MRLEYDVNRDVCFFFFQAEDGIRDTSVTGVQTCALPICSPGRTAAGAAFLTWVFLIFVSGSADRVYVFLSLSYNAQIWFYRVAVWVLPAIVFVVVRRWCVALQAAEAVEHEHERAVEEARAESVT